MSLVESILCPGTSREPSLILLYASSCIEWVTHVYSSIVSATPMKKKLVERTLRWETKDSRNSPHFILRSSMKHALCDPRLAPLVRLSRRFLLASGPNWENFGGP